MQNFVIFTEKKTQDNCDYTKRFLNLQLEEERTIKCPMAFHAENYSHATTIWFKHLVS